MLNELKTAITVYVRNIAQAELQAVFVNKIKRVQACIDARGHNFQHLLQVHSDFPNFTSCASPCAITFQLDSAVAKVHSNFLNALYVIAVTQKRRIVAKRKCANGKSNT